jgi:transcriptional regulator with XRE-family HTH domain
VTQSDDLVVLSRSRHVDKHVLGAMLRILRKSSGRTAQEFSRRSRLTLGQLAQAESGESFPSRDVLHGYLVGSGSPESSRHVVRDVWHRVYRIESLARLAPYDTGVRVEWTVDRENAVDVSAVVGGDEPVGGRARTRTAIDRSRWPDPATIETVDQWTDALQVVKRASALSYAAIAEESKRCDAPLARSSIHTLCTKAKLPNNPAIVRGFIRACGGDESTSDAWHEAWLRLRVEEPPSHVEDLEAAGGTPPVSEPGHAPVPPPDGSTAGTTWVRMVDTRLEICLGLALFVAGVLAGTVTR